MSNKSQPHQTSIQPINLATKNLATPDIETTDVTQIRDLIQQQLSATKNLNTEAWWLLGTVGCHLCDDAENTLRLFSGVVPITFQKVDIADFDETLMNQFATTIPVILTPNQQLNYPFSIVDLMALNQ